MAGWIDNDYDDAVSTEKGGFSSQDRVFEKPKKNVTGRHKNEELDVRGFDVDDSFDRSRDENEKENDYPIRSASGPRSSTGGGERRPMPSSAAPTTSAPVMSKSMMDKVREKSAIRASLEKGGNVGREDDSSHDGDESRVAAAEKRRIAREGASKEYAEHTDDDLDELRKEEEDNDIIRHPSVNMSNFKSTAVGDSDDSIEGSDEDGEDEINILGERSGVNRMPDNPDAKPKYNGRLSYAVVAHESGTDSTRVQCTMLRDRFSSRMFPEYQLILDCTQKPIMLARKQSMNATSNYHIFDLSRGAVKMEKQNYSKKSGNYLGKLRACNMDGTDYCLVTSNSEKAEVAAISYERSSIFSQIKDGSQPRKLYVVVPHLDADSVPVPNVVTAGAGSVVGRPTIAACVRDPVESQQRELYSLGSKEPVYENGNYRLNFYGRVSPPSVKNFQIVSVDDPDDIICQFGKVGDDKFHLDFKAPISPFQAFGIALTQFNI